MGYTIGLKDPIIVKVTNIGLTNASILADLP